MMNDESVSDVGFQISGCAEIRNLTSEIELLVHFLRYPIVHIIRPCEIINLAMGRA